MRSRTQRRFVDDARDGRVRALARRAAGPIGHRHELGRQRCEPLDGRPQLPLPSFPFSAERTRTRRRCRPSPVTGFCFSIYLGHHLRASSEVSGGVCVWRANLRAVQALGRPQRDGQFVGRDRRGRRQIAHLSTVSPASVEPFRTCSCEAETLVGLRLAQELQIVGREIDDQQLPRPAPARAPPRGSPAPDRTGSAAPDASRRHQPADRRARGHRYRRDGPARACGRPWSAWRAHRPASPG